MKKILILIPLILSGISANAQLARWVLPPVYDSIMVKVDHKIIATDSLGKTSLWTPDGKLLFSTENAILPFHEGVATIMDKEEGTLTGFINMSGHLTELPGLQIAYGNPYFHDGYLACMVGKQYCYYNLDGNDAQFPKTIASYPFHHGYAVYLTADQLNIDKNPRYGYHSADGKPLYNKIFSDGVLSSFESTDFQFLSSLGPDGKGVAVIKNKLYWFNSSNKIFEPMLWGDPESYNEKKRHLRLNGDYDTYFTDLPKDEIQIYATYGKKELAILRFNKELAPVKFIFGDEEITFTEPVSEPAEYHTRLSLFGTQGHYGLSMDYKQVLPQQFEEVGLMYDNRAFVKLHGKWGIIEIIPDLKYNLHINKGKDIAFRHQEFETHIRLDLPVGISAKNARIDIPESSGCIIDKTSIVTKDTESGNFVLYDCTLNIPASLPDTITRLTYRPVSVSYDGISLFDTAIDAKAWHLKYYNVDPIDSETTVENGVASFTININAQKNTGEGDYPFDVRIEADSITVDYVKISETRYKCTVYNLKEGENDLNIFVTEKGCPSSVFPFEITYTKPVPQKKEEEKVVIRKIVPTSRKESTTARLEI